MANAIIDSVAPSVFINPASISITNPDKYFEPMMANTNGAPNLNPLKNPIIPQATSTTKKIISATLIYLLFYHLTIIPIL